MAAFVTQCLHNVVLCSYCGCNEMTAEVNKGKKRKKGDYKVPECLSPIESPESFMVIYSCCLRLHETNGNLS